MKSACQHDFSQIKRVAFFLESNIDYNRHSSPYRRADLTASASLQPIRGEGPQLHVLCLASAASLARE